MVKADQCAARATSPGRHRWATLRTRIINVPVRIASTGHRLVCTATRLAVGRRPVRALTARLDPTEEGAGTGHTATEKGRLNLRHVAIIQENGDILPGRSVIDIASHDGRWSFGALQAGVSHVTGIERRRRLVENTRKTFAAKGVPESRYTMIRGDVYRKLLKHTARYVELMAASAARTRSTSSSTPASCRTSTGR